MGSKNLKHFLEQLYEKRGATREAALSSLIQSFSSGYQYQFSEKNFTELVYQYLKSFKRGSAKENCLALEALGLLAITVGCGENGRELYKESAPVLSEALNTKAPLTKLKLILDSLAIITFVGGNEWEETERTMQSIWHFMHSKADLKEAQSAAVFSWSLLLSTMDSWTLSYKHWRGAIPFFKNLLEADHESTVIGARQALGLILELGCLEKFEGDTSAMQKTNVMKSEADTLGMEDTNVKKSEGDVSAMEETTVKKSEGNSSAVEETTVKKSEGDMSAMEEMTVKKSEGDMSMEEVNVKKPEGGTSAMEEKNVKKCKGDMSAIEEMNAEKISMDGCVGEISVKIGKQILKVNTSPHQIQLNFFKRLLGSGFVVHMRENELLHDVFKFKPEKRQSGRELYVAERDEAGVNLFVPAVRREDNFQRIHQSKNSIFVKAKTQIRNKNRDIKGKEQWCSGE